MVRWIVAEVGEIGEGGFGREEGGHAPLGQPALESDVASFVADAGRGEVGRGVGPCRGQAWSRREERSEFRRGEASVVILVKEKEEVDEEVVAGRGELG